MTIRYLVIQWHHFIGNGRFPQTGCPTEDPEKQYAVVKLIGVATRRDGFQRLENEQ